jgi:hypothetical protein
VITAKDVRALVRSAHVINEIGKDGQYALVWRACIRQGVNTDCIERWFLPDTKPDHISWWIGGAHFAYEDVGCEFYNEELALERV